MPAAGIIGAVIGAAGSAYAANKSAGAAKSAANAQRDAQMQAIDEQRRQYDLSRSDEMPYMQAGRDALAQLQALNSGDFSSFHAAPDYQFALTQGLQGLDRSAAARGSLYSGGHSADVTDYAEGLANRYYDDYYNKIAGLANLGQDATARTGVLGAGAANAISGAFGNIGDARAQGIIGGANAWANGINSIGSAFGRAAYGFQNNVHPVYPNSDDTYGGYYPAGGFQMNPSNYDFGGSSGSSGYGGY